MGRTGLDSIWFTLLKVKTKSKTATPHSAHQKALGNRRRNGRRKSGALRLISPLLPNLKRPEYPFVSRKVAAFRTEIAIRMKTWRDWILSREENWGWDFRVVGVETWICGGILDGEEIYWERKEFLSVFFCFSVFLRLSLRDNNSCSGSSCVAIICVEWRGFCFSVFLFILFLFIFSHVFSIFVHG